MTLPLLARSDVPAEHTWDTDSIFPTPAAWEAEMDSLGAALAETARFKGRLGDSPATLVDWFDLTENIGRRLGKLAVYASLNAAVDAGDQVAAARADRARGLMARAAAATAFAEPELLSVGLDRLRAWATREPRLAVFNHYFDRLERREAHIRSAEVEEALSQAMDPLRTPSAAHSALANAELMFRPARGAGDEAQDLEVAQSTITGLLSHPDRAVRRSAWENYADAHLALKNTMANLLSGGVKQDVFLARARRYENALDAALTPNFIPVEVFHNLIRVFQANLPTWHKYWRVRRQALGYDTLQPWDVRAPLTPATPKVSYEQAVDWIGEGMRPLGDEYVSLMRRGALQERWVDKYPNKGKRMGAFSAGSPGTHPFLFLSYQDDLFSLSTLAHELGHSLHSYFTWQAQPFVYSRYGLFVAEVASNFNQALVRDYLLKTQPERDVQIAIIEEAMANFHRYFFIMPTLARFELETHTRIERGEALTADGLIDLMADLFQEGYGDEVVMDRARVGITWAQFHTHLYSNFYVYQYATGISGAHALAASILAGQPGAAEKYIQFLKAGGSLYPLDALALAGVDLTSPAPVEQTFAVLARYVDHLSTLTTSP